MAITKTESNLANIDLELAKLYGQTVNQGSEDASENLPQLKIHNPNSDQKKSNTMKDGKQPDIGQFFYSASKEAYDDPLVWITVIRRGELPGFDNPQEFKEQFLVAGILQETKEPFVHYVSGLGKWLVYEFYKDYAPYKRQKPFPLPMYSLSVQMVKVNRQDLQKKYPIQPKATFIIQKDKQGNPLYEKDVKLAHWLQQKSEQMIDVVESILKNKGTLSGDAPEAAQQSQPLQPVSQPAQDSHVSLGGQPREPEGQGASNLQEQRQPQNLQNQEVVFSEDMPF